MSEISQQIQPCESTKQPYSIFYPFRWDGLENFAYPLDDNGIPQVFMGKKIGVRYNYVTIMQYGLFNLQRYSQSKNEKYLFNVKKVVSWLVENFQTWHNDIGAWIYDYDLEFYRLKAPWISGMAQGQGISLLLRYYQIVPDARMLEISKQAFRAFLQPVSKGGVVACFPDSSPVFEEFPTNPASLVLNGHIFALLGIHDYGILGQDKTAIKLFQDASNGMQENLKLYDTGYWNFYDLHPTHRLASPMYVKVHVQLLNILAKLTEDQNFKNIADKWQKYEINPYCRLRWVIGKIGEKARIRF